MYDVVGVRFKKAGKIYYFDPGEFAIHPNTARYGVVRFVVPADGVYDVTAVIGNEPLPKLPAA